MKNIIKQEIEEINKQLETTTDEAEKNRLIGRLYELEEVLSNLDLVEENIKEEY